MQAQIPKTLPPEQTSFTGTDGKVRLVPGRKQPSAAPAQAIPQPGQPIPTSAAMSDTGKLVQPEPQDYGKRPDGSAKGNGFLGPLTRPDGKVSTEISIRVNIDDKEIEIPTLVPTLTLPEINALLALKDGEQPPADIVKKAVAYARKRIAAGKPVFATPEESEKAIALKNSTRAR